MADERLLARAAACFTCAWDTDSKREVKGAEEGILSAYADLGITFDEGPSFEGEKGAYGPYRQSRRRAIYRVFAKKLVAEGKAYPCFCSKEELDAARARQKALKLTPGYYGQCAPTLPSSRSGKNSKKAYPLSSACAWRAGKKGE